MDPSNLNSRILAVAHDISKVDTRSGTRLRELAGFLQQPDYGNQAALDLYNAIDPRSVEESAFLKYQRRSWLLSVVEWLRNIVVLAPICITWYGLWQGTRAYQMLISSREDLITRPFLLLWEEGFKELGTYTGLRFSDVAWLDFVLLVAVVLLTVIVHYNRDIQETRATRKALLLRQQVEDVLWESGKLFSEERYRHQAASIVQFDRSATVLVRQLEDERARLDALIAARGSETANLTKLGDSLRAGAQDLQALSKNLQKGYEPLRVSLNALGQRTEALSEQQAELQKSMMGLGQNAATLTDLAVRVSQSLRASSDELGGAADRIADNAVQSTAAFVQIRDLLDQSLQRNEAITANLRQATATACDFSDEIAAIGNGLRDVEQHIGPVLHNFANRTEGLTDRFETTVSTLEHSGHAFHQASKGLAASSDQVARYAEAATDSFQQAGRQMTDLGRQLATVAQELQEVLTLASGVSRMMNDSATQLQAASRDMLPVLDTFAKQTALAGNQLAQSVNQLNRVAAPRSVGWRPEQWVVIGLGLVMMGGIFVVLTVQVLGLF